MSVWDSLVGGATGTMAQELGIGGTAGSASYGQGLANQINTAQYNSQMMANNMSAAQQRRVNLGPQAPIKPFNPNELEAYQIPLSQLVTLWRAKYGDEWVNGNDDHKYDFYSHACTRLTASGLFETVHGWCRLKEDV